MYVYVSACCLHERASHASEYRDESASAIPMHTSREGKEHGIVWLKLEEWDDSASAIPMHTSREGKEHGIAWLKLEEWKQLHFLIDAYCWDEDQHWRKVAEFSRMCTTLALTVHFVFLYLKASKLHPCPSRAVSLPPASEVRPSHVCCNPTPPTAIDSPAALASPPQQAN